LSELQNAFAQYAFFAWLLLLVLLLVAFYWLADARRRVALLAHRYTNLTKGVDDVSIVAALDRHAEEVQHLGLRVDDLAETCAGLRGDMKLTLRRVGIIRYNPFGDTGGDQSFALALLDDQNDGVVLSSIFGRNESRLYAKPVKGGKSKYTLTAEEDQAIVNASLLR
jgi:hypothetical protein